MKRLLLLFVLVLSFKSYAQYSITEVTPNSFTLQLQIPPQKYDDSKLEKFTLRKYNNYTDESINEKDQPNFSFLAAVPNNAVVKTEILKTGVDAEKNVIPDGYENYKSKKILEDVEYFRYRDFKFARVKLNRSIFNEAENELSTLKNIVIKFSFEGTVLSEKAPIKIRSKFDEVIKQLIVNPEIAEQFRIKKSAVDIQDNWFNYNQNYLKIGVAKDAIYRIGFGDLSNLGLSVNSINPKTFQLYLEGEEIPIFLSGEDDLSFNENDFIEFYGHRNYGGDYRTINPVNEPYNEYLDRYTDTTVYWLTWGDKEGLRIKNNILTEPVNDTLTYHKNVIHYEVNRFLGGEGDNIIEVQEPEWNKNESWFEGQQGPGTRNYYFNVNNMVPEAEARAYFKLMGNSSSERTKSYLAGISINDGEILDSGYFNRTNQKLLYASFPSDFLENGENKLTLHSFETENTNNYFFRDWYDVEYYQYNSLENDSLLFRLDQNNIPSTNILKFTSAAAEEYILYKNRSQKRVILNSADQEIYYPDSTKLGDEYFISSSEKIKKPTFYYIKEFKDLTQSSAEYILLTHPYFMNTAGEYINFIESNYNIKTELVNIFDIYDNYGYGFFNPEAVKTFFKDLTINSEVIPSYAFLVGEANYDYYNNFQMENPPKNFVPSYGHPVSDSWFVTFNDTLPIPQINIGRLAVKDLSQFQHYFQKHQNHLEKEYDKWNKSYLLISGGKDESEQALSKSVNDDIKNESVIPPPVAGFYGQLYSTSNPETNFGPFPNIYVDSLFDAGGIIISYIGHSGTKIWDNGIEDPRQLSNSRNKNSFISDFGCSTGKFAEPDVVPFAEQLINGLHGQAIGYIGNSSLGFISTSTSVPQIFYQNILQKGYHTISEAHTIAKAELLNTFGSSSVNKVFSYTNTFFGDPIVELKIPPKPNLKISKSDIVLPDYLDDNLDSIEVTINYVNIGKADTGSFIIKIEDNFDNKINFSKNFTKVVPDRKENIKVNLPVRGLAGKHILEVIIDTKNNIDELYENDNNAVLNFNILTSSVRPLVYDNKFISNSGEISFLNPSKEPEDKKLFFEYSKSEDFLNKEVIEKDLDSVITEISLRNLEEQKRYYYRTKFGSESENYFPIKSFVFKPNHNSYSLTDSLSFSSLNLIDLKIHKNKIKNEINLILSSAGYESGGVAKIQLNGIDYAVNEQGCGYHILEIDANTYTAEKFIWSNYWAFEYTGYDSIYKFLSQVDENNFIAVSIGAECGGYRLPDSVQALFKEFGSSLAGEIGQATSWIFLGRKGASPGSMPEYLSKEATVSFDTVFVPISSAAKLITEEIGPAGKWEKVNIEFDLKTPITKVIPIVNSIDTLTSKAITGNELDLSFLNEFKDEKIKFIMNFDNRMTKDTIVINAIDFNFDLVPELHTSYELVSFPDSADQGEELEMNFSVFNAGETTAENFDVVVELRRPDLSSTEIFKTTVDSLQPKTKIDFQKKYTMGSFSGEAVFNIIVDPQNRVPELFTDNNFYSVPVKIIGDTSRPNLKITFDGTEIFNGEYVSSNPNIKIELFDKSNIPIVDTSAVTIFLNNQPVYFSDPGNNLIFAGSGNNPKATINYNPDLEDGEYVLKIFAKDASGNAADSAGTEINFVVDSEPKLLYVYNFPNPFADQTFFTFKLTQIPDEMKIKVYTIAGRLIREINLTAGDLRYDFNKTFWDGRDEDGDLVANGTYLYKVIMKKDETSQDVIQKLSVVR